MDIKSRSQSLMAAFSMLTVGPLSFPVRKAHTWASKDEKNEAIVVCHTCMGIKRLIYTGNRDKGRRNKYEHV